MFHFKLSSLTAWKCNLDSDARATLMSSFHEGKRVFYCALGDPVLLQLNLCFSVDLSGDPVYVLASCEMGFGTNQKAKYSHLW